ncbi:hypothetical protein OK349_13190 [Sphingomonas sp. BT-65]|uniref:hypothetical protein n=1 Tax=Sphingomonas sp. BT-65 TaxID=2989821 RepID=UPI002236A26F|nr:hypothetical protein [Sphingomonas sp. BT-65]MCW4462666.1 hypothetical protein [Sphingomonas sp. BT-65]
MRLPDNSKRQKFTLDLDKWSNIGFQPIKIDQPFTNSSIEIGRVFREFRENLGRSMLKLQGALIEAFGDAKKISRLESAGWLPHSTSPFHLITKEVAQSDIGLLVNTHYRDNWASIKAEITEHIAQYDLDEEAKATFLEALEAHESGYYRAVVRLMFPEIERIACKEIYGGKQYEEPEEEGQQAKQITNLTGFRKAIGELPLHEVVGFDFGLNLYHKLDEHLYKNIGSKPKHIRRYEKDPVPNRHASIHGLVSYATFQNSINMLIMADFMYHLFSGMKTYINSDGGGED